VGTTAVDEWSTGDDDEALMGRWSRLVAQEFLAWVDVGPELGWLDVATGTGALAAAVAAHAHPREVLGIDAAGSRIATAAQRVTDPRVRFEVVDANELAYDREFDVVVSGLALPFLHPVEPMVGYMREAVRPGGVVAAYIWDHAGHMDLLHHYWGAAVEVDPGAVDRDEAVRFADWTSARLAVLWHEAGLGDVLVTSIEVALRLVDFADLWDPLVRGRGPAPTHLASLDGDSRAAVRDRLRARVPTAPDGSITLGATALAVKGVR
jgi:SAM-dependent methyltransferase